MRRTFEAFTRRRATSTVLAAMVCSAFASSALASQWSFHEGFDGTFAKEWSSPAGAFPTENLGPWITYRDVVFQGAPQGEFVEFQGKFALEMQVPSAPDWSRFGWITDATLDGSLGRIEARVNTGPGTGGEIDGLFELWLLSASDASKYVHVGLFADQYDSQRSWTYGATDQGFHLQPFEFASNTWYDVAIVQSPDRNLEAAVYDLNGEKLVSHILPISLGELGDQFRVGIAQFMGFPNESFSLYGLVDFVQSVPSLPGDFNLDGDVDLLDFAILRKHFGGPGTLSEGDLTGDGVIDLRDFAIFKANFGATINVAEPSSGVISLVLLLVLSLARRKVSGYRT